MAFSLHNPFARAASVGARMDGTARALATIAFLPLFLQWTVIVGFVVPRLGALDFLRLHYTASGGVDWVGNWYYLFLYPCLGLGAFVVNLILTVWLGKRDARLSKALLIATAFVETLLAVGGVLVVLLNG